MAIADIINYYVTQFTAIDGESPYAVAVAKVNELPTNNLNQSAALSPGVSIVLQNIEPFDTLSDGNNTGYVCPLLIIGWVALEAEQIPHDALLPLYEDVKTAIKADRKCGGYAVDIKIGSTKFFGDEKDAQFEMSLSVYYVEAD